MRTCPPAPAIASVRTQSHARSRKLERSDISSLLLAAALWLPFTPIAASTAKPSAEGVLPLIAACKACHGSNGISVSDAIPNLAGQKPDYLSRQLLAFRQGERKNDLMAAIAAQLSDADIESLAAEWSTSARPGEAATRSSPDALASAMRFPADFPRGFEVYLVTAEANSGAVMRRYANQAALQALRNAQPLPSGAVIIASTHEALRDDSGKPKFDAHGDPMAGTLISYAGMEVRTGWGAAVPRLLRNGDWNFALFDAAGNERSANHAACLACHKPAAADDHVFSIKAMRAFASSH